jgi:hypothetical protein
LRKLPDGWSWPLKPSDLPAIFPGVSTVYWYGPAAGPKPSSGPLVLLAWSARPDSRMPEPTLMIWAVPSEMRARIRGELQTEAAADVKRWLSALADRGDGWRMLKHLQRWEWSDAAIRCSAEK